MENNEVVEVGSTEVEEDSYSDDGTEVTDRLMSCAEANTTDGTKAVADE